MSVEKFETLEENSPEQKALERLDKLADNKRLDELFRSGFNYQNEKGNKCWLTCTRFPAEMSFFEKSSSGLAERTIRHKGEGKGFELVTRLKSDDGEKVERKSISMDHVNQEIDKFEHNLELRDIQKKFHDQQANLKGEFIEK